MTVWIFYILHVEPANALQNCSYTWDIRATT